MTLETQAPLPSVASSPSARLSPQERTEPKVDGRKSRNLLPTKAGSIFGKLTLLEDLGILQVKSYRARYWRMLCECGTEKVTTASSIKNGHAKTCGCSKGPGWTPLMKEKTARLLLSASANIPKPDARRKPHFRRVVSVEGTAFGQLTYLRPAASRHRGPGNKRGFWLCRCSCGKEGEFDSYAVRSGNTRSCGCSKTLPFGIANQRGLFSRYVDSAIERGLCFELSLDEFLNLTSGHCAYCGVQPSQIYDNTTKKLGGGRVENGALVYNGIDRVDNDRGYTQENCVSCCGICNGMKRTMSEQDFLEHIAKIQAHRTRRQVEH